MLPVHVCGCRVSVDQVAVMEKMVAMVTMALMELLELKDHLVYLDH